MKVSGEGKAIHYENISSKAVMKDYIFVGKTAMINLPFFYKGVKIFIKIFI